MRAILVSVVALSFMALPFEEELPASPDRPSIVREPFPGFAALLTKEGFTMAGPRFTSSYSDYAKPSTSLVLSVEPVRTPGGRPRSARLYGTRLEILNKLSPGLRKLNASFVPPVTNELPMSIPGPECRVILRLSGLVFEGNRRYVHGNATEAPRYVATARPVALSLLEKVATNVAATFSDPRWFERWQQPTRYMAGLGFRPFLEPNPSPKSKLKFTPDWNRGAWDLSFEFGKASECRMEMDANGYPIAKGAGAMIPLSLPVFLRSNSKVSYCASPDTLVSAFETDGDVFRITLRMHDRPYTPQDHSRPPVYDPGVAERLNRIVIGLKALAGKQ